MNLHEETIIKRERRQHQGAINSLAMEVLRRRRALRRRMGRELAQMRDDYEEHPVFAAGLRRRIHLFELVLNAPY